jgi:hypothetical protein
MQARWTRAWDPARAHRGRLVRRGRGVVARRAAGRSRARASPGSSPARWAARRRTTAQQAARPTRAWDPVNARRELRARRDQGAGARRAAAPSHASALADNLPARWATRGPTVVEPAARRTRAREPVSARRGLRVRRDPDAAACRAVARSRVRASEGSSPARWVSLAGTAAEQAGWTPAQAIKARPMAACASPRRHRLRLSPREILSQRPASAPSPSTSTTLGLGTLDRFRVAQGPARAGR